MRRPGDAGAKAKRGYGLPKAKKKVKGEVKAGAGVEGRAKAREENTRGPSRSAARERDKRAKDKPARRGPRVRTDLPRITERPTIRVRTDLPRITERPTIRVRTDLPRITERPAIRVRTDLPRITGRSVRLSGLRSDLPQITARPPGTAAHDTKGASEFRRAERHKRTPAYRAAIRAGYDATTPAQRRERIKRAHAKDGRASREDLTILHTSVARARRHAELSRSSRTGDTKSNYELRRGDEHARSRTTKARPARKREGLLGRILKEAVTFGKYQPDGTRTRKNAAFGPASLHAVPTAAGSGTFGRRPRNLARAFAEDPKATTVNTLKGGRDALQAIPGGVVDLVTDPVGTTKASLKDMADRAGESDRAQVKRIKSEGAFADMADASVLAAGPGSAISRGVLTGVKRRRPNSKLAEERPRLRTSGGAAKKQRTSRGVVGRAGQLAVDELRARRGERRLQEAELGDRLTRPDVEQAARANRRAGRTVEVAPLQERLGANRAQHRGVAKVKSRAVLMLKAEQQRVVGAARKAVAGLNKAERRAFFYASTLGIRTPEQARTLLGQRIEEIVREREADGFKPKGRLRRTDELPTLRYLIENADDAFTPELGRIVEGLRPEAERVGREDPALRDIQRELRIHAQQAALLGVRRGEVPDVGDGGAPALRYFDEEDLDFVERVAGEAAAKNLARPLYITSERFDFEADPDFAARAAGGAHAVRTPFQYKGRNYRLGLQDTSPEAFYTGLSRNIKRRHNWNLVAETMDAHAIDLPEATFSNVSGLKNALAARGIDPRAVALWRPGVFRHAVGELDTDPTLRDKVSAEDRFGNAEDDLIVGKAARQAGALLDDLPSNTELLPGGGWKIVPKAAFDEIMAATKPSGALGRGYDIFKGKQSRALLLAGNLPWLQFQVVSNAALTGAATGLRMPIDMIQSARWWHRLDPKEREAALADMGGSMAHDAQQVKMGAASHNLVINGYRAFKQAPIWRTGVAAGRGPSISQLNPLELMASADRAQTNVFRRTILYNRVKADAFRRMYENASTAQRLQGKITEWLTLGPEDQMRAILNDRDALEQHADAVSDWLGDYVTYTKFERQVLNRLVMFYGFMRFSLRFAFYTMPVKHPLMTSIIAELGQLQAEEIKDLLGGDELPWALGKVYFTKDGELQSIDLSKANPAINQALGTRHLGQVISTLPPVITALIDQIGHKSVYMDGEWKVMGEPAKHNPKHGDYGERVRARIAADDLASMIYAYRVAEKLTQEGPQGDDSLLGSARPTRYKRKDIRRSTKRDIDHERQHESLLTEVVPLLPRPSRDPEIAKEKRAQEKAKNAKPKKATKYFGARGGRSGYFGASR